MGTEKQDQVVRRHKKGGAVAEGRYREEAGRVGTSDCVLYETLQVRDLAAASPNVGWLLDQLIYCVSKL